MSVVLSPAETEEVTRFGIHDEDVWRQVVENAEDEFTCDQCDRSAACIVITRCCGAHAAHPCEAHRREVKDAMTWMAALGYFWSCKVCRHTFVPSSSYSDIFREVTL